MLTLIIKSALLCLICFFLSALIGHWLGRRNRPDLSGLERSDLVPAPPSMAPIKPLPVISEPLSQPTGPDLTQMNADDLESLVAQSEASKPEILSKPKGNADDLKLIIGIGPVNEKELNALGIFHFWQIAAWTPAHISWVSSRIRFAGRITRENWMRQARELMKTS